MKENRIPGELENPWESDLENTFLTMGRMSGSLRLWSSQGIDFVNHHYGRGSAEEVKPIGRVTVSIIFKHCFEFQKK